MHKTNKSILKRVKITGQKKILRRQTNQNHFNAKDPGQKTGAKRSLVSMTKTNQKKIEQAISHHL